MSESRFADGVRYRIEIPSVEGPRVLEAVLDEAEKRSVPVRRVSQGSGVMMLTDAEIRELAVLGAETKGSRAGADLAQPLGASAAYLPLNALLVCSGCGFGSVVCSEHVPNGILHPCSRRVIVTPEAGSRPVGARRLRRSARSPACATGKNGRGEGQ